jgi:hypothetical protein
MNDAQKILTEIENSLGQNKNQFIKIWYEDRRIEAIVVFDDGSYTTFPVEYMERIPVAGDPKHYEWEWRNNQWVQTVEENY